MKTVSKELRDAYRNAVLICARSGQYDSKYNNMFMQYYNIAKDYKKLIDNIEKGESHVQ